MLRKSVASVDSDESNSTVNNSSKSVAVVTQQLHKKVAISLSPLTRGQWLHTDGHRQLHQRRTSELCAQYTTSDSDWDKDMTSNKHTPKLQMRLDRLWQ